MKRHVSMVISIPVHEKPDVIRNQIENFQKYITDMCIVLHISNGFFEHYRIADIGLLGDVYINPTHLDTKWADIIHTHLSNFHYISEQLDFDYFVLHASNDMYIRKGFTEYIKKYDAGFNIRKVIKKHSHWWPGDMAMEDKQLQEMMDDCGQTMIIASQVESSFYKREIMEKIVDMIEKHYDVEHKDGQYPREEIYFPTIASNLVSWDRVGLPTTFSEVHRFDRVLWRIRNFTRALYYRGRLKAFISQRRYNGLEERYNQILFRSRFYKTTPKIIDRLLKNDEKYIYDNSFLDDGSGQFQLYDSEIFSVKRIERDMDDQTRKYITGL